MSIVRLPLREGAWWLHPAWTAMLATLPGLLAAWLIGDDTFREWWRTPKLFDDGKVLTVMVFIGVFIVGCMLPSLAKSTRATDISTTVRQRRILFLAGRATAALTLVGYVAWMASAITSGLTLADLANVFSLSAGSADAVKSELGTIGGVTTLTQLGPLAMICLFLDRRLGGRSHTVMFTVLTGLTLARVVLNSERLALMEIALPILVVVSTLRPGQGRRHYRWVWAGLPLLAPFALVALFGTFEYVRSWSHYSSIVQIDYSEFVLRRLTGYYATAYNNSAIVVDHIGPDLAWPYYTVGFLWNFPGLSAVLTPEAVLGFDPGRVWPGLLWQFGNPEYNNTGGMLAPLADYGLAGGMVFWAAVGLAIGVCYRWMRSGEMRGLILYPLLYVGLVDLVRYFYWGEGRAFPMLAGALLLALLVHRRRAPEEES
ncbi:O-antigen polymerase [Streptosporangium subroseum]|uniref:O-antigen polymerase n=1 Tax=Streptosporangium subroseum TaxID=106412 RepID=UPI003417E9A9